MKPNMVEKHSRTHINCQQLATVLHSFWKHLYGPSSKVGFYTQVAGWSSIHFHTDLYTHSVLIPALGWMIINHIPRISLDSHHSYIYIYIHIVYVYYIYMQCIHYIYNYIHIDTVPAIFGIDPSNDPEGGNTELRISGHWSYHLGFQWRGQRPAGQKLGVGIAELATCHDQYIYIYIHIYIYIYKSLECLVNHRKTIGKP